MTSRRASIYMDNHATTRLDPRVLDAMMPYLRDHYGNAASRTHSYGWEAEAAVERARTQVAALIGASPKEIVWTSGATESDNLAIKGVVRFAQASAAKPHIVTVQTEHKAVLDTCKTLERRGEARVTYLKPDPRGLIAPEQVEAALRPETVLVSIMHANNEIGVIQPIGEIGAVAREHGAFFHTDAAQSVGKIPVDIDAMHVDLLSISAHKLYGPKGAGALFVRSRAPRVRLAAEIDGGGHERGMRSGTVNVPGVVGLGTACELAGLELPAEAERVTRLRESLRSGLFAALDQIQVNGDLERRLPGNLHVSFACVEGESLLMALDDIALSSGSACTSATLEPSYVLKAIGTDDELAHSSLRFGLGRFTTAEEIDRVVERVVHEVRRLRALSPLYRPTEEIKPARVAP